MKNVEEEEDQDRCSEEHTLGLISLYLLFHAP
jgi:hypothetical protein